MERIESESEYLEEQRRGIQEDPQPKINLDFLVTLGEEKGFEVEKNIDYGYGSIDLVWYISLHPMLQSIRCGFIVLGLEEELIGGGGSKDSEDNQYSMRKIEEAAIRGVRSGMDKV